MPVYCPRGGVDGPSTSQVWPPVAIFGGAALCLGLFFVDVAGAFGDWCHVPKYGDFATQDASACE